MTSSPDILTGHKEIARFLGLSPRQVEWHDARGNLPTFKLGKTVCARKAKLMEWVESLEQDRRKERDMRKRGKG